MKILQHLALSGPFFATFCSAQDLAEVAITNNLNLLAAAAGAAGILPALSDPGPLSKFCSFVIRPYLFLSPPLQ